MSYVSDQYRAVWVHNPKTGGTSIADAADWIHESGHVSARDIRAPRDYFWFGFVRHPADRLYSTYHAAIQHRRKWDHVEQAGTFDRFVLEVLPDTVERMPHTRPQTWFLCDPAGNLLMDYVGRYERLEADWRAICEHLNAPSGELRQLNATEHGSWQLAYTPEMREMVSRIYRCDFELFGYSWNAWNA